MKRDDIKQLQEKVDQLNEEVKSLRTELNKKQDRLPTVTPSPYIDVTTYTYIPPACRSCPNHPSNGGSGVCHCILGLAQTTC